jgi:Fe-S cluster assembly protein SufB
LGALCDVSRLSDEQVFYLQSRGLTETAAKALIVNGFFEAFTKELPMEYAVELNRLITLQMEGSIG